MSPWDPDGATCHAISHHTDAESPIFVHKEYEMLREVDTYVIIGYCIPGIAPMPLSLRLFQVLRQQRRPPDTRPESSHLDSSLYRVLKSICLTIHLSSLYDHLCLLQLLCQQRRPPAASTEGPHLALQQFVGGLRQQ